LDGYRDAIDPEDNGVGGAPGRLVAARDKKSDNRRYLSRVGMPALNDNPFAVLTAVVAPAILTNASSVLSLGTGNRIARVVDRTTVLAASLPIFALGRTCS
jgi:hypothetical protein